jgi:hypothetical protein
MRVFSNVLLVAALASLGVSIWFAPRVRGAGGAVDTSGLILSDPLERGRWGDEHGALGVAISGYGSLAESEPGHPEATNGLMRAAARLAGVGLGNPALSGLLVKAFSFYVEHHRAADPDGAQLDAAIREFARIRGNHPWYVARAGLAMFLLSKDAERANAILDELMKQGPLWREWFPAVQRHLPAWHGIESNVRHHLEHADRGARVFAGVTLMMYRRIYDVGNELWEQHREAIGKALLDSLASMMPDGSESYPSSQSGMVLLGLALYDSPASIRIVERLKPVDHPYLPRVVTLAKLWAGLKPFSSVDFEDRRYDAWSPGEREFFYRGALLYYAKLVREGRDEEARAMREGVIADALVEQADVIKIMARRSLAAVHPDQSEQFHRAMYEAGAIQRVYGAFGLPDADRVSAMLPALSAPDPGISALAAVGLLPPRDVPPIQMPKE